MIDGTNSLERMLAERAAIDAGDGDQQE